MNREDTSLATARKREFYVMLDLNRLMLMTSQPACSKIFVDNKFQQMLVQLMRIEPEINRTEAELELIREDEESVRLEMLRF